MDETMKNTVEEINEQENVATENEAANEQNTQRDELREAIEAQMEKIRRQSMLIGAQTICRVILDKIVAAMNQPGKRTNADHKRLIKDIEKFCRTGVSRKVSADGETEPVEEEPVVEETIQN